MADADPNRHYAFYEDVVKPLYGELVAAGKKIPDIEQRKSKANELALSGSRKLVTEPTTARDELANAYYVVVGIGFDVAYALANERAAQSLAILGNRDKRRWCALAPKKQVDAAAADAAERFKVAMANKDAATPQSQEAAIAQFKAAAEAYKNCGDLFDPELLADYEQFLRGHARKNRAVEIAISIGGGILSGVLLANLPSWLRGEENKTPPGRQEQATPNAEGVSPPQGAPPKREEPEPLVPEKEEQPAAPKS